MGLSKIIRVAEQQGGLLSDYSLVDHDGQMEGLEKLHSLYVDHLAILENIIKKHELSLRESCEPILKQIKILLGKLPKGKFTFGTVQRKSYEAIYDDSQARESDSSQQRGNRNKQYQRSLKIQALGCDRALVFAGALTASEWVKMSAPKFHYILEQIPKPPQECLPALMERLEAWATEEPLARCAAFKNSLTG